MANQANYVYIGGLQTYAVSVNDTYVYYTDDGNQAKTISDRLNRIFQDLNRDLDFITPSIANGYYVVSCSRVRGNIGEKTYLYDTDGSNGWRNYPEKLYNDLNWQDSTISSEQTAILTITGSSTPWVSAVSIANNIRNAISLNFNDAAGRSSSQSLTLPSNQSSSVAQIISSSARCDFYGLPCQGTEPGEYSDCPELGYPAQNILNTTVANGEVFHPQDLTAAITSSNNWYTNYKNKFVKVTNLSNGKSIIVRITDQAPSDKGIELSYRAWKEIDKPSGNGSVKIELMA